VVIGESSCRLEARNGTKLALFAFKMNCRREWPYMGQYKTASGIQISYNSKKENFINEILRDLIDSIQSGNFLAGVHVSPSLLLISSILNISGITDEEVITSIVFRAGVDIQGNKVIDLPSFFEAVGKTAQGYLNKPHQEFHLVFPLNYKRGKLLSDRFSINRLDFEVTSWSVISSKYDITSLCTEVKNFIRYPHDAVYWHSQSSPLFLKIYGRSTEEVFRRGEKAYEILITSINYILDRSIRFQFTRNSPLAEVLPAVGYGVFLPSGKLECSYSSLDFLNLQTLCEADLDFARLQTMINLAESENILDRRFIQALLSHREGLETTLWDVAFLSYWRVLEILAFGERIDYDMNDVVKRICILLKANNNTKEFLNLCASRRNNLVHRGVFSHEGQPLVLILKWFTNYCLSEFEKLIKNYRTEQEIEQYYEQSHIKSDLLEVQRKVIDNILAERNPNKL